MARERDVKRRVVQFAEEHDGCLQDESPTRLRQRCGAGDMSAAWFQQLLAHMKQRREIRGFSLKAGGAYVKI